MFWREKAVSLSSQGTFAWWASDPQMLPDSSQRRGLAGEGEREGWRKALQLVAIPLATFPRASGLNNLLISIFYLHVSVDACLDLPLWE